MEVDVEILAVGALWAVHSLGEWTTQGSCEGRVDERMMPPRRPWRYGASIAQCGSRRGQCVTQTE